MQCHLPRSSVAVLVLLALSACPAGPGPADGGMDAGEPLTPTVTVHYHRGTNDYTGWTVAVASGATPASAPSTSTDGWGSVHTLTLDEGATSVTFAMKNGAAVDPAGTLTADLTRSREIWLVEGLAKAITRRPLAVPSATEVALYYQRADDSYMGFGLHLWGTLVRETSWATPLPPVGRDPDLGMAFLIPLASGTLGNCKPETICLIMHKGDTKDPGPDMYWSRAELGDVVFLTSGSAELTRLPQKPGGVKLSGAKAHLLSRDVLVFDAAVLVHHDVGGGGPAQLEGACAGVGGVSGGQVLGLVPRTGALPAPLAARAPHLASWPAFDVAMADRASVPAALKGQVVAVGKAASGAVTVATTVQTALALDDLFATTAPLGPRITDAGVSVSVWAPTAQTMRLRVHDATKAELAGSPFSMVAGDAGVWTATGPLDWKDKFYRFELTVFHPATGKVETLTATDPYATSLSTNSTYAQFVDLSDPALVPPGWATLQKPALAGPQDVVLYEGHVRDFSVSDSTVPQARRGKYLAFTEQGSDGMKHLAALADAGLTHLHLLPAFDIATVDEDAGQRLDLDAQVAAACARITTLPASICSQTGKTLREAMATLPGDSQDQQAVAGALRQVDSFNWGYDPLHYGVPEGSYASNAEGSGRILEFRQMVAGLNQAGLRVVLDVVYNHTNASGITEKSVLDKLVPGYYHRLNEYTGQVETSTCCANTATEHVMMQRLMVDTLVRWARDYKVDGFRFDLMGHHLVQNMVEVKQVLGALTPAADGVDGSKLVLYGEGWDFGEVQGGRRGANATQRNMFGTGIATFNDRLRDGVRGGGPFDNATTLRPLQGFATGLIIEPNEKSGTTEAEKDKLDQYDTWTRIGMAGSLSAYKVLTAQGPRVDANAYGYNGAPTGYTASPLESVNYVSAHDNQTLWDIAQYKLKTGLPAADRARTQIVALATVALGQGVPFFHLGDDLLRSKSMDKNSYDSSGLAV